MSKSTPKLPSQSRLIFLIALALVGTIFILHQIYFAQRVRAASSTIVISELDADTPLAGTDTANEWFELQNVSASNITLTGWTITDNVSSDTIPTVTIGPGGHVIVAATAAGFASEHPGFTGTVLTIADGAIGNGLANGGDVLILKNSSAVTIDSVSWGTNTTAFNPAAGVDSPTNTNQRNAAGTDTDTAADWTRAAETPNGNTNVGATTNPSGVGTANPNSVLPGESTLLTVNVTPGANPPSTGLAVTADLSSIGGSATQSFSGSGNTFTFTATVSNATTTGPKTLPFTITDAQSRSGNGSISLTVKAPPPPNNVVISQVYGGGGNNGSTFTNDFIELINHGSAPVSLNGWSVQVFVGGNWVSTPLTNFMLQPGQYYLIQESQGAGGTDPLPTPDAVGTITVSSTSTKVALVNNTTLLTGACPDSDPGAFGIVDFVGYGGTDCWEGSGTAPLLDNLTADFRRNDGCFDTNDNKADFITDEPNPRNSSSPTHDCTTLFGYGSANPSSVLVGNNVALRVDVAAAQNPASAGITVTADLSSIGGSPNQAFSGSGSVFTFNATVSLATTGGFKSLPVTITDAQVRTFNTNIVLSVLPLVPEHVTISQIYGGGGNAGAPFHNDYVELYNPTALPVTVTGWSIQYASATGTSWTNKQPIGGVIPPLTYYLVALGTGTVGDGAPLPASQISGGINMSATAGKVALVSNSNALSGGCPLGSDPDIVDFVGYGSTANCHEGSANTPAPDNTTAIFRKLNGGQDTDQNGTDFITGAPNPRQTAPIVELGPWVAGTDPPTNGNTVPHDASITIDFSEAVNVDPGWYNINCTVTGPHNNATLAHTTSFKTYAITPNVNFQFSEQCTVTIFKTAVHDQDNDDIAPDTDTLFEDYTWSFTVVAAGQPAPYPPSVHLTMGDPGCGTPFGCALASLGQPNNFLMEKPTYSLSYNRDKGTPNWVSWHLEPAWYGTLARVDTFRPDPAVDPSWYRVQAFDYSGSGFDRGHMTPNADRDNQFRVPINQETYLMSNMVPQAPDNNQGPWAALEGDLRLIADAGNELYIVSGPLGVGGSGSNGGTTTSIANGHVTVPASTWKVALVLPNQTGNDVSRVTCSTRTIAVLMPNVQGIRSNPWQTYLTTVDDIEQQTGYDFFSNLPPAVQACVEAGTNGTNPPGTADESATTTEDNSVTITLQALQSTNNTLTFSIMSGPSSGSLGSIGPSSCANGACTATVTYTPGADFNGSDSFTFRANDGAVHSNTSTVAIGVSEVNDSPTAADDSKSTPEDTPLTFPAGDLTTNDSAGPANEVTQSLTVTSVTGGPNTHGAVGLASGTVTYTPDANYNGAASFTYTVCDNGTTNGAPDSKCATATVNVTVNAVNDDPVAAPDSASTDEDNPVTIDVVANDTDVDGDTRTLTSVGTAAHGSVSIVAGQVLYSPAPNFHGNDSFTYVISDGHGGQATGSVSVVINPVNDAPTANSQSVATNANTSVGITLTGSDVETAPGNLTFTVTSGPSHGLLLGTGANRTYSPGLNYSGPDSFKFTVTDTGDGSSAPLTSTEATVFITVNDTVAPIITLNGNSISLWPPNHTLFTVNVADLVAGASDNFDATVDLSKVEIASVSSDEGTAASGDILIGATCKSVQLRAERNGNGDGRVYTITFRVRDTAGNTGFATAKVTVPHDQGHPNAVDSGVAYTVISGCP